MFRVRFHPLAVLMAAFVVLASLPAEAGQGKVRAGRHLHATAGYSNSFRSADTRSYRHGLRPGSRQATRYSNSRRYTARHGYRHVRKTAAIPYWRRLDRRYADGRYDDRRYDRSGIRHLGDRVPTRRYYDAGGSLVITIGSDTATDKQTDRQDVSGVVLENGRCAAGEYCNLRLGSYSSSPKIITLNNSGKTITDPGM